MTRSPWVRLALALLALTVLALGALRSARVWAERQFEKELGSLEPAAYTRPAVKTDDNAARYFLAAVGKLRVEEEETKLLAAWALHPEDPADGRLSALVAKNEPALRLAKQGAGLFSSFYGLDYASGFHAALPDLPQLVTLGRLLGLEARLARERGETGRMVSALSALASLAASLESEPGITVFHAGVSLERLQLAELALALEDPRLPTAKLAQLRDAFSPVALEEVFRRVVGLEEASLRQEVPEKPGSPPLGRRISGVFPAHKRRASLRLWGHNLAPGGRRTPVGRSSATTKPGCFWSWRRRKGCGPRVCCCKPPRFAFATTGNTAASPLLWGFPGSAARKPVYR
jgi:hypothetical protein